MACRSQAVWMSLPQFQDRGGSTARLINDKVESEEVRVDDAYGACRRWADVGLKALNWDS